MPRYGVKIGLIVLVAVAISYVCFMFLSTSTTLFDSQNFQWSVASTSNNCNTRDVASSCPPQNCTNVICNCDNATSKSEACPSPICPACEDTSESGDQDNPNNTTDISNLVHFGMLTTKGTHGLAVAARDTW